MVRQLSFNKSQAKLTVAQSILFFLCPCIYSPTPPSRASIYGIILFLEHTISCGYHTHHTIPISQNLGSFITSNSFAESVSLLAKNWHERRPLPALLMDGLDRIPRALEYHTMSTVVYWSWYEYPNGRMSGPIKPLKVVAQ